MGRTYTSIVYHLVIVTKGRNPTLWKPKRKLLYKYLSGLLEKKRCFVHAINGVEDHVHLVFKLHPGLALANLVKDLKLAAHVFIKDHREDFLAFEGWQLGYAAFTCDERSIAGLIAYVNNQEEHHRSRTSLLELELLLHHYDIEYDPKYFE